MSRYTNILLASMAAAVLLLSGALWQSADDPSNRSFNNSHPSYWGCIWGPLFSLEQDKSIQVAAAEEDSDDSKGEKKDGKDEEDGGIKGKELWDSVQLG